MLSIGCSPEKGSPAKRTTLSLAGPFACMVANVLNSDIDGLIGRNVSEPVRARGKSYVPTFMSVQLYTWLTTYTNWMVSVEIFLNHLYEREVQLYDRCEVA